MADQVDPAESRTVETPRYDRDFVVRHRPVSSASDIVPVGPNAFATMASFISLLAAPWVCIQFLAPLWENVLVDDAMVPLFILVPFEGMLLNAAIGALAILVIGVVLQVCEHHCPFRALWPILLAFPITWSLIVPEALLRGGSFLASALTASAIAVAFSIHWVLVVVLSDAMG